jgi:hypothetical protein
MGVGEKVVTKQRIVSITSRADFEAALTEYITWRAPFCDEHGESLPKYSPAPMVASFMRDPADAEVFARESIPVPKGPVDTW